MADAPPPEFDPSKVTPMFTASGHSGWLGLTYADHGDDWVELELPWREDLLGDDGQKVLASGPILSLMDMASGLAIWRTMNEFRAIATLDLRVDYVRPARERSAVFGRYELKNVSSPTVKTFSSRCGAYSILSHVSTA